MPENPCEDASRRTARPVLVVSLPLTLPQHPESAGHSCNQPNHVQQAPEKDARLPMSVTWVMSSPVMTAAMIAAEPRTTGRTSATLWGPPTRPERYENRCRQQHNRPSEARIEFRPRGDLNQHARGRRDEANHGHLRGV